MIVTYKYENSTCKVLKLNSQYLVKSITGDSIIIFGYIKKFEKYAFVKEDGSEIDEIKYLNKLCVSKRSVKKGVEVLCVENYGDDRVKIGSIHTVIDINYYSDDKIKLMFKGYRWNDDFDINMFILYDSSIERYRKSLNIFNDINLY